VMNFTSNATALLFFLLAGQVQLVAGLVMGAGQFLGARIGARLVITKGAAFVRPVFITMVLAVLIKLILQR
ncbi:MAG: TSUP family transporter, partial [Geobacter sp.]